MVLIEARDLDEDKESDEEERNEDESDEDESDEGKTQSYKGHDNDNDDESESLREHINEADEVTELRLAAGPMRFRACISSTAFRLKTDPEPNQPTAIIDFGNTRRG